MDELHTEPKHPLRGATPSPTSTSTMFPLDAKHVERATAGAWCSIARLTPDGGDVSHCRLPT